MARGRKSRLSSRNRKQDKKQCNKKQHKEELVKVPLAPPVEQPSHVPENQDRLELCLRIEEQTKLESMFGTSLATIPFLHGACALGKYELVKRILRSGPVDLDAPGPNGGTPLLWAIRGGRPDLVSLLRTRGASLDTMDDAGDCPMTAVAEHDNFGEHIVMSLLEEVPKPEEFKTKQGNTLLHLAIRRQWSGLLESCLSVGVSVDQGNVRNITPLMLCAAQGLKAQTNRLLQAGASVDNMDERGCTALCYALAKAASIEKVPKCEVVELLIGASRKIKGKRTVQDHIDRCLINAVHNPPTPATSTGQLDALLCVFTPSIVYLGMHHGSEWNACKASHELLKSIIHHENNEEYCAAIAQALVEVILSGDVRSKDEVEHSAKENQVAIEFMSNPNNAMQCLNLAEKFLGKVEVLENTDTALEVQMKIMPKGLMDQVSSGVQEKWLPASWALMLPMLCACATCCIGRSWLMHFQSRVAKVLERLHPDQILNLGKRRPLILRRVSECRRLLKASAKSKSHHLEQDHGKNAQYRKALGQLQDKSLKTNNPVQKSKQDQTPKYSKVLKSEPKGKKKAKVVKEPENTISKESPVKVQVENKHEVIHSEDTKVLEEPVQVPQSTPIKNEDQQPDKEDSISSENSANISQDSSTYVEQEDEEEPPSVEKLRNLFMSLTSKYERLWDNDRRAGYPGFIDKPDTPLGSCRETQLQVLRSMERQYLNQMRNHWATIEPTLLKLSPSRYNLESKRLFRVISEHKVRNSSLEINEEPKSRWNHVETYLKTEDIINMAPAGLSFVCHADKLKSFLVNAGGKLGKMDFGQVKGGSNLIAMKCMPFLTDCKIWTTLKLKPLRCEYLLPSRFIQLSDYEALYITPLCEYNLEEYIHVINGGESKFGTEVLIKQMVMGLHALHQHDPIIIHGNLKPSNVLIDSKGCLRLAEFGLHEGPSLYTIPAKFSVLWFARENLRLYKKYYQILCTTQADIQTLGMLMYFLSSGGLHPFGNDLEQIETSIANGIPRVQTTCCDFKDLVLWTLHSNPFDRPTTTEILKHVYFWDPNRRWTFLMMCLSLPIQQEGREILLQNFHDEIAFLANKFEVRGDWYSIVKRDFAKLPELNCDQWCPISLIKFIGMCMKSNPNDLQIRDYFLTTFPALPLAMNRLVQATKWVKDKPFSKFLEKY